MENDRPRVVATAPVSAEADFAGAFVREYPGIVAVAYRVLGDRADAEDVAQDLFARCLRRRTMPTPGALRLAAARSALNLLRSRRRRIARELTDYRLADASLSTGRTNGEPFAALDRAARATLVRAALLRLRPRDAELLVLRYGGASYRDAALTLGIDAAQVGTRLVRAERAFRTEIERAATS